MKISIPMKLATYAWLGLMASCYVMGTFKLPWYPSIDYSAYKFEFSAISVASEEDSYFFDFVSSGFSSEASRKIHGLTKDQLTVQLIQAIPHSLKARARRFIPMVLATCERQQVDPLWVLAIMWTESHFSDVAISQVGAYGPMQIMPRTRKFLKKQYRASGVEILAGLDLTQNRNIQDIELAVFYLKRLLKRFHYKHRYATVAYNMGPSWTSRRLRKFQPVGEDNLYLDKVKRAYARLYRTL